MKFTLSTFLSIGFFLMGAVQLFATWDFLTGYWGWPSFFAGIAGFILAGIPLVGSVCGFIGALKVWHWEWWQAGLLFFWWPALALLSGAAEFFANASLPKRIIMVAVLIGIAGGGGWWLQQNNGKADWWEFRLRASSEQAFAKDFIEAFHKSPAGYQAEVVFSLLNIAYIEQMRTTGSDPLSKPMDEERFLLSALRILYVEARKIDEFTLGHILALRAVMAKQYPAYDAEFQSRYAPAIKAGLEARMGTMRRQELEDRLQGQLDMMTRMAEDLRQ